MKRILVTGVSGFCGRVLAQQLTARGHEVFGTVATRPFRDKRLVQRLWQTDVRDEKRLAAIVRESRPDWIFHLAALSIPRLSWKDPVQTTAVNTGGTVNLLRAILREAPKARLVFVSTSQVYGRTFRKKSAVSEMDPVWPENPYAASKLAAEMACLNFVKQHGLDVVIARPFNHFGRGMSKDLVFSDWCRQIIRAERGLQEPVLYVGNLEARRDFLYVGDVVRAYFLLAKKGQAGQAYNVCTGRPRPLTDCTDFMVKQARIPMRIQPEPGRFRREDPPGISGSPLSLRRLGWRPRQTAMEGLVELISELRELP